MNDTVVDAPSAVIHQPAFEQRPANLSVIEGGRQLNILERSIDHALRNNASLDQLQQLMEMKERFDENEARKAFTVAMAQFKQNPPEIIKDKQVGYDDKNGNLVGYRHATLAAVCDAAIKGLALVGISHRWDPKQQNGYVGVSCVLTHAAGHSESVYLEAPADTSGKKNSIQAIGSSVTYLQRYTLLAITGLATKDQDNDGGDHKDPLPDWVDVYLKAINTAATKEDLAAAWRTAIRACTAAQDTVAGAELREAMMARGEELGLEKKS